MMMPFGEYEGRALSSLPDVYLVWLTSRELRGDLRSGVEQEILRRFRTPPLDARTVRSTPAADVALALIDAGLRSLARRCHPDLGGTHEAMLRVTQAAEWLRHQLQRVA